MEMNYIEYLKYVEHVLNEKTIGEYARQMKAFGKFKESKDGLWEPVPYSGYTVITPAFRSPSIWEEACEYLPRCLRDKFEA
ncbi:hypothetical protein [Desulfosporosinus sp. SB140]|uniref:hypothetical protein n=1 Tax=Desulfosporosinus paludis TaxID=3115649 RepID=UPI00388E5FC1